MVSLPRPFRCVIIEPEVPEVVVDPKKGKAQGKGKAQPPTPSKKK